MIDNVILNQLANQNKAPCDLIKKRAENKGLLTARTNAQLTTKHSKHSISGQLLPKTRIQSNSNSVQNQSTLHSVQNQSTLTVVNSSVQRAIDQHDKIPNHESKRYEKFHSRLHSERAKNKQTTRSCSFGRLDEHFRPRRKSLRPRWHKRPPTKDKQTKKTKSSPQYQPTTKVIDARNLISGTKSTKFPKIIFGDFKTVTKGDSSQTTVPLITHATLATQTTLQNEMEKKKSSTSTQTSSNTENTPMEQEIYVSREDPNVCLQEETSPNVEPPTKTTSLQLEASHTEVMDTVVATVEKATETEEDTPLFRRKLQKVLEIPFIAAATKKDRNLRPLINFVKKPDWDAIKASNGQYWFNIRNRLHVREDCLLVDERIVIPSQLRQTVLDSLHLTHPGSAAMLDLSQHVWFPHIIAQLCRWHKTVNSARSKVKI